MVMWNNVEVLPPEDTDLEVIDNKGNIRWAVAAYFPFKKVNGKLVECDPIFDGFLVSVGFSDPFGEVVGWRLMNDVEYKNKSNGWLRF